MSPADLAFDDERGPKIFHPTNAVGDARSAVKMNNRKMFGDVTSSTAGTGTTCEGQSGLRNNALIGVATFVSSAMGALLVYAFTFTWMIV